MTPPQETESFKEVARTYRLARDELDLYDDVEERFRGLLYKELAGCVQGVNLSVDNCLYITLYTLPAAQDPSAALRRLVERAKRPARSAVQR